MLQKMLELQKKMNASNGEMAKACSISYGSFNNRRIGNDNFTQGNYNNAVAYFTDNLKSKLELLKTED